MNRSLGVVNLGEGCKRYLIQITSDPCEEGSREAESEMLRLISTLGSTRDLLIMGQSIIFDQLTMKHDGISWVVHIQRTDRESD